MLVELLICAGAAYCAGYLAGSRRSATSPEPEKKMDRLGDLRTQSLYRRESGRLYYILNEGFVVPVVVVDGQVIGDGIVEELNPDELVRWVG